MKIKLSTVFLAGFSFLTASLSVAQGDTLDYDPSDDIIVQELSKYKQENYTESFNKIGKNGLDLLNERLINRPDSPWLYVQRGWLYISMGQLDNAIADFNKSIQIYPNSSAYMGLGMAYNNQGNTKLANESYLKALNTKNPLPSQMTPNL